MVFRFLIKAHIASIEAILVLNGKQEQEWQ